MKQTAFVLTSFKLLILSMMILTGVRTQADPGTTITEILVINQKNYENFEDIFYEDNKRAPVLKFLPHPRNPNYMSIYLCSINSEEQALGGRNCQGVSGGQYFNVRGLRELEKAAENRRLKLSILKEATIFVVTLPIGGGIYRGLIKGARMVHAGATAYRTVRWGAFGLSFASDILIGHQIDKATENLVKVGPNHAIGKNVRCVRGERCEEREAVVVVDNKVKLVTSFRKLDEIIPKKENGRKFIEAHVWVEKKKVRACQNCYDLEVVTDFEQMYNYPVY